MFVKATKSLPSAKDCQIDCDLSFVMTTGPQKNFQATAKVIRNVRILIIN